jgi:cardiolipin hydrolase
MGRSVRRCVLFAVLVSLLLTPAAGRADEQVGLSTDLNPIGLTREAVDAATESIEAVVYKFDEGSVEKALKRALRRGVRVRIVTDGSQAKRSRSRIGDVLAAGAQVHAWGPGKLHAKWTIVDGKKLITGSFNWTESAQHDNLELVRVVDVPATVKRYRELFQALWDRSEPFGG